MASELERLFFKQRLPGFALALSILLYSPVGVTLMVLRLFIAAHAYLVAWLLPRHLTARRYILRVLSAVCGIVAIKEESEEIKAKQLVSNHITGIDGLALQLSLGPLDVRMKKTVGAGSWWRSLAGVQDLSKPREDGSGEPVLTFPEDATTSGRRAILKFSEEAFGLEKQVQPVVLMVNRQPAFTVAPSTLMGTYWGDFLWTFFIPLTFFRVRVLPVVSRGEEESVQDFSERVRSAMCGDSGLQPVPFTAADKADLIKRLVFEASRPPARAVPTRRDAQLEIYVERVKGVLTQTPEYVIRRDLVKTRNVDVTIANILEGRADTSPPPKPRPAFSKSAKVRVTPMEERKQALIELGREIYRRQHNL